MLPQKSFEILSPLRVTFKPSESDLRPSTDKDTFVKDINFLGHDSWGGKLKLGGEIPPFPGFCMKP